MKEVCDVGRWKLKRGKCSPCPRLPHEIIENILSRLPVKDLLRFRVVCKRWEATVSDPTFVEIHLQRHSRNLLAWMYNDLLDVAELRNNCIEFLSAIECGLDPLEDWFDLCSCDGLYLKYFQPPTIQEGECLKCLLWNPSRRTYREFYCPPSINARKMSESIFAVYYVPLMKDYKIVIGNKKHYAVYSCRDNKWGDVKEMKAFFGVDCKYNSVFVNGSIYWMVMDWLDGKHGCYRSREVICFDCKDESFKILPLPSLKNRDKSYLKLTSFGGELYLFISSLKSNRLKIMKKVTSADGNDEWMESEKSLYKYRSRTKSLPFSPVCQMSKNELLFYVWRERSKVYMLYDKSKNTVVEIHNLYNNNDTTSDPSAHLENLFLL